MTPAGSADLGSDAEPAADPKEVCIMAKRERVSSQSGNRYIRRDERGRFTSNQVDVGASQSADRRKVARTTVSKGDGDRDDRSRRS
jgi:hypothetical protein